MHNNSNIVLVFCLNMLRLKVRLQHLFEVEINRNIWHQTNSAG